MTTFVKSGLLVAVTFLLASFTLALKTIEIQTTAVCGMCKDRIEGTLSALDGVEEATLDMESKIVTISYDDTKQSPASLRSVISRIGYAADGVASDTSAWEKLPACCKAAPNYQGASAAKACSTDQKAAKKSCCKKGKGKAKSCGDKAAGATAKKSCCKKDAGKSCSKKS